MPSHDVNIKYIPGKDPAMVFLNADNKVVLVSKLSSKDLYCIKTYVPRPVRLQICEL